MLEKILTNDEISLVYGGINPDTIRIGRIIAITTVTMFINYTKTTYNGTCNESKVTQANHTIVGCRIINDVMPTIIPALINITILFVIERARPRLHGHAE